ncbi:RagB/SusD family nutrient uptake outer membrane protein [Parafilimonas sp.]|uniref:RagB/SusD family nutrient uptake outer membrane protein n=1 Tax=Parafilimonas sp. TaxID=1969739 RepID=UPI0039E66BFB
MKSRHLIFIFLISVLFACNKDLLSKLPLDSPSDESFFSTQEELDLAINGAYTTLWWESGNMPYYLYLDATTDIAWSRGDYANVQTVQSGQFTTSASIFSSTWEHWYNGISMCNNILENMYRAEDVVEADYYNQIRGQALFLRSFCYFYLIELYGGVPWVTTMLSLDSSDLPRTAKEEIVQHLYDDLDTATLYLPSSWSGSDEGRATKGAALTLKARLALDESDYETAAASAKAVIDLGIYSIYSSYEDLFHYAGESASEIILPLPYLTGVKTNNIPQIEGPRNAPGYSILVPTQMLVDMYECTDGKPIDESSLYDPLNPFENRDPRLDQSIIRPGVWFNNYLFMTHPDSTKTYYANGTDTTRVENLEVTNAYATFTGYLWLKYLDESDLPDNVTTSEKSVILMRYAEVLLTYAEAKIELDEIDAGVIDAINEVRTRASVNMPSVSISMSQDELRDVVRYERTVELANEGFRLFDIRRWEYAEHIMPGNVYGRRKEAYWYDAITPDISQYGEPVYSNGDEIFNIISTNTFDASKNYLWPIPQEEMDVNENMEQNPGY